MKTYNEDQFKGNWKQMKGALKEQWGEFTDDDLLAIEGRADRFEGKVQERYGERKEEVREWVDNYLESHPYDPHHEKAHN
ncbi:MAG: CsbD family protein [Nitrospirales bacterium]